MKRGMAIKEVIKFIATDSNFGFEERLILLKAMEDVKHKIHRNGDRIDTILLRLKYGAKQKIPDEWSTVVSVPKEIEMVDGLIEPPVSRSYIKRGGDEETEIMKPTVAKLSMV